MSNVINKNTGQYLVSVHTPDYIGNSDWIINPTSAEIEQYKYEPSIEEIKNQQLNDLNNQVVIDMTSGYNYNGDIISTSLEAQANWNNLINRINAGYDPTFPYPISLINGGVVMIQDKTEMLQLFKDASEYIENIHNTYLQARLDLLG
jgi:hypothetical protein